jgi:predicted permease
MRELSRDVAFAWRRLRRTPAFTLFAVSTLALSIGATTAIYSAVYAAFLRPPMLKDPGRVANLYHRDPRGGGSMQMIALSQPDFLDFRASQTSFEHLTAWTPFRHSLVANGTADVVAGEMVSGDYFAVVGIDAAMGRTLQPADDRPGASRVIVLSDAFWRRRFGADPAVVGRTVNLGGDLFEVVGVMPAAFRGVSMPNVVPTPAWVPLSSTRTPNNDSTTNRERRWLRVQGRLKPGRSMAEAFAEFRTIGQRLDAAHPVGTNIESRYRSRAATTREWFLMPAADVRMHESIDALAGPLVATIMVTVGLVLMVACTNIANLMLARAASKRHEAAVRLALGVSRWRLVREQLVESALVTAAGGLLAFVVARVVMAQLLISDLQMSPGLALQFTPEFHGSVAAVALAATLLALVVFGVIPALHGARADVREALASGESGTAAPRWRGRRALIACQVAVSAGLVAVAVLCAQQVAATARHHSGIDLDRIAAASVDFRMQRRDEAHGRRVLDEALHLARLQPGVEAVAASSGLPLGLGTPGAVVAAADERGPSGMLSGAQAELVAATPAIFPVLGVDIVAGRAFDDRDSAAAEPVVIVSRTLATRVFGESNPVGRRAAVQRRRWVGEDLPLVRSVTVVGITEDTDVGVLGRRDDRGVVYLPFAQHYEGAMTIVARAASDPAALPEELRRIIQRVDPETAVLQAAVGRELDASQSRVLEVGAAASSLLGGLALVLAMAGLYGVMADLVARRTPEIGIRIALGADYRRMLRMVLTDGTRPVVTGLAIGTAVGILGRMAFRPMFIRILPSFDPIVFLVIPVAFLAAAIVASYLPARRAARVDPNVALRHL